MAASVFSRSGVTNRSTSADRPAASVVSIDDTQPACTRLRPSSWRSVGSAAGKFIRSPVGKAIGGALKGVAKKALPLAGSALGGAIGGPLGAKIGGGLANVAGKALGLEAESLTQEDHEFEGARQFVRVAANTVNKAASAPPNADPRAVAQMAATQAVRFAVVIEHVHFFAQPAQPQIIFNALIPWHSTICIICHYHYRSFNLREMEQWRVLEV